MYTTNLRKAGGSVMLSVPPAILELLHLYPGATAGLTVDGNRLVIEPQSRLHYSLEELLAQCDSPAEMSSEDQQWLAAKAVGS